MLSIVLPATDDPENPLPEIELLLEHSLVSMSRWEAQHEKAFYGKAEKTSLETVSYLQKMLVNTVPPIEQWLPRIQAEHYQELSEYINSKQSATWFREDQSQNRSSEVITSELVYYWMLSLNIPFQPCETWHFNRLMTLIRIVGIKQTKPKKMSKAAQAEQYRKLNAQRREQLGTTG